MSHACMSEIEGLGLGTERGTFRGVFAAYFIWLSIHGIYTDDIPILFIAT